MSAAAASGDLRARILRASVELLEQEGVAALSLREVARRAGVSHQAPYHHFADREAILGAIAQEGFVMLQARLDEAMMKNAKNAFQRFEHAGVAYVEFALEHTAHFRLMFRPELVNVETCPGAKAAGDSAFARLVEMVSMCFDEGLDVGEGREAVLAASWSVAHGLSCLLLDGPLARTLPDELRERGKMIRSVLRVFRRQLEACVKPTKR
jgi:AcrR family transcriptional regulator